MGPNERVVQRYLRASGEPVAWRPAADAALSAGEEPNVKLAKQVVARYIFASQEYEVQTKAFGKWTTRARFPSMDKARFWAAEKGVGQRMPYRFVEPDGTALTLVEVVAKYGRLS